MIYLSRHRMTEQEEDEELLADLHAAKKNIISFDSSPNFIKGGTMRDYQVWNSTFFKLQILQITNSSNHCIRFEAWTGWLGCTRMASMEFWLMRWVWEKPFKPYPCWATWSIFAMCLDPTWSLYPSQPLPTGWTSSRSGVLPSGNPCCIELTTNEDFHYHALQGCLFDWRPRNAKCVHQGCHDARRLGCCRHQLRDDSKRKECVQEVQLEVHGDWRSSPHQERGVKIICGHQRDQDFEQVGM